MTTIEETNNNCNTCEIILTDDDMHRNDGLCEDCLLDEKDDNKWFNEKQIEIDGEIYLLEYVKKAIEKVEELKKEEENKI